jgi:hypothetical protein
MSLSESSALADTHSQQYTLSYRQQFKTTKSIILKAIERFDG